MSHLFSGKIAGQSNWSPKKSYDTKITSAVSKLTKLPASHDSLSWYSRAKNTENCHYSKDSQLCNEGNALSRPTSFVLVSPWFGQDKLHSSFRRLVFPHIYNIEVKSSSQRVRSLSMFTCQLKMSKSECPDDSEFENFSSLNYSKFAAHCDK